MPRKYRSKWGVPADNRGPFVPRSEEGVVIETGGPKAEEPYPCRAPGPGGLKPCVVMVQDSASWVSDGHHDGPHIWWAQEGRALWVYEENPLEAYPTSRFHADLTTSAALTVDEVAALVAFLEAKRCG